MYFLALLQSIPHNRKKEYIVLYPVAWAKLIFPERSSWLSVCLSFFFLPLFPFFPFPRLRCISKRKRKEGKKGKEKTLRPSARKTFNGFWPQSTVGLLLCHVKEIFTKKAGVWKICKSISFLSLWRDKSWYTWVPFRKEREKKAVLHLDLFFYIPVARCPDTFISVNICVQSMCACETNKHQIRNETLSTNKFCLIDQTKTTRPQRPRGEKISQGIKKITAVDRLLLCGWWCCYLLRGSLQCSGQGLQRKIWSVSRIEATAGARAWKLKGEVSDLKGVAKEANWTGQHGQIQV